MSLQILQLRRDFLRVSGEDRRVFLQGQVTCDVEKITATKAIRGALCNLKGRVIADFIALQIDDEIILQCNGGMGKIIHATLQKYAVFSKVSITLDASLLTIGLISEKAMTLNKLRKSINLPGDLSNESDAITDKNLTAICTSGVLAREQIWLPKGCLPPELTETLIDDEADWNNQDILCGIAHIREGISEQYTPQLLNYDVSRVIDFKKGCYTGQEVVARMYYRGTPKKRLFLLNSKAKTGNNIVSTDGSKHEIIAKSFDESGGHFLAVLPVALAEDGAVLKIDDQYNSETSIQPLPYEVDRSN